MKTCPFCAEEIRTEAIKCKHCGEFLDEKSLQELVLSKKTDRQVFNREEVADYLRAPIKTIDEWVSEKKMPFSRLPNKEVVFHRKDIDKWISQDKVTEYHRFVSNRKTIDDILPPSYKPLTEEEELADIINDLHEKFITKPCKKHGYNEAEYARTLKDKFVKLSVKAPDKTKVIYKWNFKKRKYKLVEGKESYNKYLKKEDSFQEAHATMSILMAYLSAYY